MILALRIETEVIFKNTYSLFRNPENSLCAMNLINQVITAVLDPNLFYSRFSFYESDKKAIDIKTSKRRGCTG